MAQCDYPLPRAFNFHRAAHLAGLRRLWLIAGRRIWIACDIVRVLFGPHRWNEIESIQAGKTSARSYLFANYSSIIDIISHRKSDSELKTARQALQA